MLQAFYTGLSGLNSYSKNLDNVSNNIANMNTAGYRGMDSFYQALGGDSDKPGLGAQISGLGYRFSVGDIRQTGNDFDLAITGTGFFALLDGEKVFYTRTGQFEFDQNNVLVDKNTGFKVAGIDSNGQLSEINLLSYQAIKPTATTKLSLTGNLSPLDDVHQISSAKMINSLGEEVDLSIKFTNEKATFPNQWKVEILDDKGIVLHSDSVKFGPDGTPEVGSGSFIFNLADSSGNTTPIDITVGTIGDFSAVTQTSATGVDSNVTLHAVDGKGVGQLVKRSFDPQGRVTLNYSNGDKVTPFTIAMVDFDDISTLSIESGTVFKASDLESRVLGKAGEGRFKQLATSSIEMSNVDLSQEFADMLVIQRGYQASSRILNVANQMIEQLYENTRGR
ncbi:protein of unknown function DUF1078-like protein [Shewanella denitrificans OS217]|jgi:flagellar hook protein FlgE|uniref:Flagellar basal-body rod protein FlgF n=1 Tax=Shewanella denitrificans (strain OS217 / ATCC BAA-1090 / DSM 15013) TaxID=318161 RepID=Q12T69_SHEDO|nr:flagellar basal-body rod protein FlgF [Shewanella denitrificans]ABE53357.1 protein of unknown function DUF1078-like protein [Shewanella denitrificans OS217]